MGIERRLLGPRVVFERSLAASVMAIDGTWQRACMVKDVSDGGCKMTIDGDIKGLSVNEFFLLLSSTGLAYRRCALQWINGEEIGVKFIKPGKKKKPLPPPEAAKAESSKEPAKVDPIKNKMVEV